jgi:hypothetical protein
VTLVQMQPRSAHALPVFRAVGEAVEAGGGPQIGDDMTVEVALSVMASARTGHLVVLDEDGLWAGRVTQAQLAAVRDGDAYTDRVRLRDVLGDGGAFAPHPTATADAELALAR